MLTDTNQSDLKNNLDHLLPISNKTKAGLILNPCSGKTKKHLKKIRANISKFSDLQICEASTLTEINQTIENFINQEIELLIIIGGDGTVQATLNCYFLNPQVKLMPKILIVPGGTTNMTAKDIGITGSPIKSLSRLMMLMKGERRGFIVNKTILKIVQNKRPDIYGMFFGAGVIANGAKFFQNNIRKSGLTGELASFIVVMNFAFKLLTSQYFEQLSPINIQFRDDKSNSPEFNCFLLFASTLDRLLFGLRPYWGSENKPIHFTSIRKYPVKFWRSLLAIILRRGKTLKEEEGYYSSDNQYLSILLHGDFIVDGEIFNANRENGELHISTTDPIQFIVP